MFLGVHGVHLFSRQHKLEEALLFSGQFMDALQALVDWLYKVEPQLAEDQPVHGDLDLVMNLMDAHKVRIRPPSWGWELCSSSPRAHGSHPPSHSSLGLTLAFALLPPGLPEGAGEAHGDGAGAETLRPGADREQPG